MHSASGSTSFCPWLWSGEMLPAYWPMCEFDLTLRVLFQVAAFNVLITIDHCLPLAPVSMCSYCLPNPRSFCKIHFPSLVQCYLVHWLNVLVNRMAYDDESTAWFRVQHCLKLKPLRLVVVQKYLAAQHSECNWKKDSTRKSSIGLGGLCIWSSQGGLTFQKLTKISLIYSTVF